MKVAPRFPLEFPVILSVPNPGGTAKRPLELKAISENLSLTGMGLGLPSEVDIPQGSTITVRLEVDNQEGERREISLKARIIWQHSGRCGLEIQNMAEEERAFYENLILGYQMLCRGFAELQAAG